jgi:hypothetical protein
MKKIFLFLLAFYIAFSCNAQKTENEMVNDIRAWYKDVSENLGSYEKFVHDAPGESTEGGVLTVYKENDNIRMIKEEYYGESGNAKYHYYFRNDKLFFMFQVNKYYDVPIYVDDSGKGKIEENRFYFYSDQMIRWLDPKKEKVNKASEEFTNKADQILEDSYGLISSY